MIVTSEIGSDRSDSTHAAVDGSERAAASKSSGCKSLGRIEVSSVLSPNVTENVRLSPRKMAYFT